ncbi:MBL fold metallo-hydrolase [Clostridium sp.]|uniref:MBL fold metallo-hydrolase n=1 Tax=Clostridium sp. TaxID=1506 RepID=UPI001A4CC3D6|nr:MBL fold metallo-hydrolase [Clostridium sp.]MBK5236620.1 MBL fold metallo-hydrolase [Clostridium sp.]
MKKGLELIEEIDSCVLEKGNSAFWWLGQMGYIVKLGEVVIYLDAFLSDYPGRNIPPLIKAEEVINADLIFGSHDHLDHIDRGAWHQISLSSPKAKFVVPKLLIKKLSEDLNIQEDRFIGIDDGTSVVAGGLKITGIAAAHEFLDQDAVTGSYPYLGFIIEGSGCGLYHSGDTCIYEGLHSKLKKWNRLDVMFIPINGRDAKKYRANIIGNMTYQEAVDLAGDVKPGLVVPGHYDMFSNNSEDPLLFIDYLNSKYPDIQYWVGSHGDKVLINL